jgi:hypothetical protein
MTRMRTIGSIGKLNVKQLYCDCVSFKPRDMDYYDVEDCPDSRFSTIQPYDEDDFKEDKDWNELHLGAYDYDAMIDDNQPMMNYFYPLPDESRYGGALDKYDAQAIINLPLCLVNLETGEYGLALTGGGMDLSWEICEAYIRLGYLPPFHFCDLPRMAGRGTSARDRAIIRGCKRSCDITIGWGQQTKKHLMGMNK